MSDLDGRCFIKRGKSLVPADIHAEDFIDQLADGKEVMITIRTPRSPQHHRWFFKYLSRVIENTDNIWNDVEELLEAVKFATGHTTRFRRVTNPHAQDMELANELSNTAICWVENGKVTSMPTAKVTKIIMALRRGADEYVTRTKSINFASLGEEKFKAFHDKAVEALNTFLGWDTTTLMKKENDI